ncbi:GNAT family N-acetyltransferase [Thalassotalea sediminis]|uniref:GNAT family N-acetyltransferase n=1 Tax=Thalassotalea sediminis TaxID=1759089 RepID=UPI002573C61D|nr:GNAT family N-acetyltransferase [Thalassotalea sediminis]
MKIRRLEPSDSHDLYEIYSFSSVTENTSQVPFLNTEIVTQLFNHPEHYTLVAEKDSKVVGHITLLLTNKVRDKHSAGLAIAVHPDTHGKGIGKALLLEAINQADNWLNLIRLELEVHSDNQAAIALYERVGFSIEGTKRLSTFKNGKYIDMQLMARIRPDHN